MKFSLKLRTILGVLVVILMVATAVFLIWAENPMGPMPEAEAALQSDEQVTVSLDPWMTFYPADTAVDTGFILYPGGRVDARAYAPAAHAIAADHYLVVVPPMPLNLAVFGIDTADEIIAAYDQVETWVIGGHSLGGAMAANYVYNHPGQVDGLVLWAAYPAQSNGLAGRANLPVLSVYGTEDGQADELAAAAERLPSGTIWMVIKGGNHAQFGWYGRQSGDGEATISRADQQEDIVQATTAFLSSVDTAE